MRKFKIAAQNLAEYAVVLTVIVMALVGLQIYVMRGLQARYKKGADYAIAGITAEAGGNALTQYDPYYLESNITANTRSNSTIGFPDSSINESVNRSGWQRVGPAE